MARVIAVCGLLSVLFPRVASAEWQFTPMIGLTVFGNTTIVDPEGATGTRHGQFGGAVDVLGGGVLGIEALVVSTPNFFQNSSAGLRERGIADLVKDSTSVALMGNVVVTAPRRWTEYFLRPFASAGLGLLHVGFTENIVSDVLATSATMAAFDLGGGAIGFISKSTGVRFDFRYYGSLHRSNSDTLAVGAVHLRYMTASVGVVFRK